MDSYLTALRCKRDKIQADIDAEYARPCPDGLILTELKKAKLKLRERIEQAERSRLGPAFAALPAQTQPA
ncbi:MAG TPA: DUF465 domain-containing protein [Beijerinckiaceae bacterium]|nr:DUF465 domain-containing protein [Beijerinckiaceae bacterium]